MTKPRFPQRDFWTGIVPSSPSSVQSRRQARRSLPTSRLLVTYLDRDMDFVWTLKHLDKTSWQRSSSVQIKPLQALVLSCGGVLDGLQPSAFLGTRCGLTTRGKLVYGQS